jgi:hypothetical protein
LTTKAINDERKTVRAIKALIAEKARSSKQQDAQKAKIQKKAEKETAQKEPDEKRVQKVAARDEARQERKNGKVVRSITTASSKENLDNVSEQETFLT